MCSDSTHSSSYIVSGGAGAVGLCVGKSILESGGDVVFTDIADKPNQEAWGLVSPFFPPPLAPPTNFFLDDILQTSEKNGTRATYHQLDGTDAAATRKLVEDTIHDTLRSPIRGLIACAGISGESDATDYDIDIFRKIMDVNVTGTFVIAREAAREMHRSQVTGSMILIASMSGSISNRGINTAAYNSSKSAILQLCRSLAAEWGHPDNSFPGSTASSTNPNPSQDPRPVYPPIRVNTLSPGHIETPIGEAARKRGLTDKWAQQNMLGRISQVGEYRAPCLFLLGEGSSYMTGAVS